MASVADRLRITTSMATPPNTSASGNCTSTIRTSWPGFCRSTACSTDNSNSGKITTPASAVMSA